MTPRIRLFILFAVAAAALFVRLGIWQLSRLHQRRLANAFVISRLDSAQVGIDAIPPDPAVARFRRVIATGHPDYAHEVVLIARSLNGSPGVYIFTPVRLSGRDTALLVNRGWVYSPDGVTVDLRRWREADTSFTGFLDVFPATGDDAQLSGRVAVLRHLEYTAAARAVPYPIAHMYLVAVADSSVGERVGGTERIVRLGIPPLDEGPHLSYAIQWFSFAVIALGGAVLVVLKQREDDRRFGRDGRRGPAASIEPPRANR